MDVCQTTTSVAEPTQWWPATLVKEHTMSNMLTIQTVMADVSQPFIISTKTGTHRFAFDCSFLPAAVQPCDNIHMLLYVSEGRWWCFKDLFNICPRGRCKHRSYFRSGHIFLVRQTKSS